MGPRLMLSLMFTRKSLLSLMLMFRLPLSHMSTLSPFLHQLLLLLQLLMLAMPQLLLHLLLLLTLPMLLLLMPLLPMLPTLLHTLDTDTDLPQLPTQLLLLPQLLPPNKMPY